MKTLHEFIPNEEVMKTAETQGTLVGLVNGKQSRAITWEESRRQTEIRWAARKEESETRKR